MIRIGGGGKVSSSKKVFTDNKFASDVASLEESRQPNIHLPIPASFVEWILLNKHSLPQY